MDLKPIWILICYVTYMNLPVRQIYTHSNTTSSSNNNIQQTLQNALNDSTLQKYNYTGTILKWAQLKLWIISSPT